METRVYKAPKDVAIKIVEDETIKRQGEATRYEPQVFGLEGEEAILVVKGGPEIFKMDLFKDIKEADNKDEIIQKIEEMSQSAASGVGNLFK